MKTFLMRNYKTQLVEVKRQIESVVEEKGWIGNEQLNQESSKGGGRFRNSPIIFIEAPKNTINQPPIPGTIERSNC